MSVTPTTKEFWHTLIEEPLGTQHRIPVITITKTKKPCVLITAAIHGDEINGSIVAQRLAEHLKEKLYKGSVTIIPVLNVEGFNKRERLFNNYDLNWFFEGNKEGFLHERYTNAIYEHYVKKADYLFDLHTARKGSTNSYHARADLQDKKTEEIAKVLASQLIMHSKPTKTTMRGAAQNKGTAAITIEIGDSDQIQEDYIKEATKDLKRALAHLGMTKEKYEKKTTTIIRETKRLIAQDTGIGTITTNVLDYVQEGEEIGKLQDIYGKTIKKLNAPTSGIIIGKATTPIIKRGRTLLHIGKINKKTYEKNYGKRT